MTVETIILSNLIYNENFVKESNSILKVRLFFRNIRKNYI